MLRALLQPWYRPAGGSGRQWQCGCSQTLENKGAEGAAQARCSAGQYTAAAAAHSYQRMPLLPHTPRSPGERCARPAKSPPPRRSPPAGLLPPLPRRPSPGAPPCTIPPRRHPLPPRSNMHVLQAVRLVRRAQIANLGRVSSPSPHQRRQHGAGGAVANEHCQLINGKEPTELPFNQVAGSTVAGI